MNDQTRALAKEELLRQLDEIVVGEGFPDGTPGRAMAFEIWVIKNIINVQDDEIEQANVGSKGGSDSQGSEWECDFFTIDNEGTQAEPTAEIEQTIIWGQVKFSENYNYKYNDTEFSRLLRVEERLEDPPTSSNEKFKRASKKFKDNGGIDSNSRKKVFVVVCGDVTQQVKEQINDKDWRQMHFDGLGGKKELVIVTTEDILKAIVLPSTPDIKVYFVEDVDQVIIKHDSLEQNNISVIGHIDAKKLAELWNDVGDTLFLENPRRYLGVGGSTNSAITKTLMDNEKKLRFWKLNNGITATCDEITQENNYFVVKNLKIVNGQQTTQTIKEVWRKDEDNLRLGITDRRLEGVQVGLKIHRTTQSQERKDISTATNRQNALTDVELMELSGEQETLHTDCNTNFSEYYYEKQKNSFQNESDVIKTRVTKRRLMLKGENAIAFYAYKFDPRDAIKKGKRKLFNETNPELYKLIFFNKMKNPQQGGQAIIDIPGMPPDSVRNIKQFIVVHIFSQILKEIRTKKWSKKIIEVERWIADGSIPANDPRVGDMFWLQTDGTLTDLEVNKRHFAASGPDHVKYYILNWIYLSLESCDPQKKIEIEDEIIKQFGKIRLDRNPITDNLLKIGKEAIEFFVKCYDHDQGSNWDEDDNGEHKRPSPDFIKKRLAQQDAYQNLLTQRATVINAIQNLLQQFQPGASGDLVKGALEDIIP